MAEFKKIKLTKEDILEIKHVRFNDADLKTSNVFDPQRINDLSNEQIDACVNDIIEKITNQVKYDFEMCCICEMAIQWLEEHKTY